MRRSVIAAIAVLALSRALSAQAAMHNPSTRSKEMTYVGDVATVNVAQKEFVVRGTQKGEPVEMQFRVTPATRISMNGSLILLSQLERGSRVTVGYRPSAAEAFTSDH